MLKIDMIIGKIPIIVFKNNNMTLRTMFKPYQNVPLTRAVMLTILAAYKRPNDKISDMIKQGQILQLKRGLYLTGPDLDLGQPHSFLISQHLRGPSYISLETALEFWGLIPERAHEISSVTLKTTQIYDTIVGRFSYQKSTFPYYTFGIENVEIAAGKWVLMASMEKAICDKLIFTSNLNIRSVVQMQSYLFEDLRINEQAIKNLNSSLIKSWCAVSPKKNTLQILVKTIELCS